jgi:hypothetical protein
VSELVKTQKKGSNIIYTKKGKEEEEEEEY